MAEAVKNDCAKGELIVSEKTRRPRFKAGAELNKTVQLVDLDWNEQHTDEFSELEVKLHLKTEDCAPHHGICK
jgi:hypothetical protein